MKYLLLFLLVGCGATFTPSNVKEVSMLWSNYNGIKTAKIVCRDNREFKLDKKYYNNKEIYDMAFKLCNGIVIDGK